MFCFLPAPLNPSGASLRSRNIPPLKYLGSMIYNVTPGVCLFLLLHDFDVHELIWVLSHHLPASFLLNIHPQSPEKWNKELSNFCSPARDGICILYVLVPSPSGTLRGQSGRTWAEMSIKPLLLVLIVSGDPVPASACVKKARIAPAAADPLIQRQLRGARASAWIFKLSPGLCAVSCTYKPISGLRPVPQ